MPASAVPPRQPPDGMPRDEDAASALELIQSVLGSDEETRVAPEHSFVLPLGRVLALLPPEYVVGPADSRLRDKPVTVAVGDLFDQLARGRVTVSVADMVFGVPADMVTAQAFAARDVRIPVPLADVVAAIDPTVLQKRTARAFKKFNLTGLPDPFSETPARGEPKAPVQEPPPLPHPPPSPPAPAAPAEPVASEAPVSSPADRETEPAPAGELATPPPAPAAPTLVSGPEPEPDQIDRLGGVNLNAATVEQLLTLEGMTPAVAQRILDRRSEQGPFRDVFELFDIPGLGRKRFRRITGMAYNDKRINRRRRLASMLRLPAAQVSHLPTLAQSLTARLGFAGCVISDADGLVLAEGHADETSAAICAIVPLLIHHVREHVQWLKAGDIRSVSMNFERRMFTVAVSGRVYLTCIHQSNRLTKSQLELFMRVAAELAWLLSHRAYVGPSRP